MEPQSSVMDACRDAQYRLRYDGGRPASLVMHPRTLRDARDEVEAVVRVSDRPLEFGGTVDIDGVPTEPDPHLPPGAVVCTDLRRGSGLVGCASVEYAEVKRLKTLPQAVVGWVRRRLP